MELLKNAFGGILVSNRFSDYIHLPIEQRKLCKAHLISDINAIAKRHGPSARFGAELLDLQQQLFAQWYRCKEGANDWPTLQQGCRPIRRTFEAKLQQAVELGDQRGERTHWAKTVHTCQQVLQRSDALWTFLEIQRVEPNNNATERALRQSVIQRKISHGDQSTSGIICRSHLHTATTTLRQV